MEPSLKRAYIVMGQQFSSKNTEIKCRVFFFFVCSIFIFVSNPGSFVQVMVLRTYWCRRKGVFRSQVWFCFQGVFSSKSSPSCMRCSNEERSKRFFRLDENKNLRLMRGGVGKPHDLDVKCGKFELFEIGRLQEGPRLCVCLCRC